MGILDKVKRLDSLDGVTTLIPEDAIFKFFLTKGLVINLLCQNGCYTGRSLKDGFAKEGWYPHKVIYSKCLQLGIIERDSQIVSFCEKQPELLADEEIIPLLIFEYKSFIRKRYNLRLAFLHLHHKDDSRVTYTGFCTSKIHHGIFNTANMELLLSDIYCYIYDHKWEKYQISIDDETRKSFAKDAMKIILGRAKIMDIKQLYRSAPCWKDGKEINNLWDLYNNIRNWIVDGGLLVQRRRKLGKKYNPPVKLNPVTDERFILKIDCKLWDLLVKYSK